MSGSLLGDFGGSFSLTFVNYSQVFHNADLFGPLERSLEYGAIVASFTVVAGFVAARLLTRGGTRATRLLDFLLLAAVALPSVVFAAGYILAYNLPILSRVGLDLYQTTTLLLIAYAASSLPTNARVLVGPVSQLQPSLHHAARAHGAGAARAWLRGVLPLISRPLVMAWLLTFAGVFLELPISQLLYAPSLPPVSVAIEDNLGNYHFGVGMAQAVLAVAAAFVVVVVVLGAYRLLTPAGLAPGRRGRPWLSSVPVDGLEKIYPGGNRALEDSRSRSSRAPSSCCSARPARARRRCFAASPGIERASAGRITIGDRPSPTVSATCLPNAARSPWFSRTTRSGRIWSRRDNVAFALRRHGHGRADCRRPRPDARARRARRARPPVSEPALGWRAATCRARSRAGRGYGARALRRAALQSRRRPARAHPDRDLGAHPRRGATTIYITHDQAEAFALADRVGVLEGTARPAGAPRGDLQPASPFVARFTGLAGELTVRVPGRARGL